MRIRTTTAALCTAAVLAVAGCSSSGSSDKATPAEPGVTAPATGGKAAAATLDAAALVKRLAAAVPTVSRTIEYTDSTDPNHRLGRPHQYTSKIQFADSRVDRAKAKEQADGDTTDIAYGGTAEVFATAADAKAWVAGIDKVGQAMGTLLTPDYLLQQGRYVIRASSVLTASQVADYKAVLAEL